jgi:hypothetical protein
MATERAAGAHSGTSVFGQARAHYRASDLDMLAAVECATGRDPPTEIYELIRLAREGSSEADLDAFVQSNLRRDPVVHKHAREWLARRTADGGAPPSGARLGGGGGARRIGVRGSTTGSPSTSGSPGP